MILIVGEDQDALLYLRNRLNLAREENINDYLHAAVGTLGEEKVAVSCVGIGLSLVGINTATLLSVYDPYLVINIGCVASIKGTLHQGDIFIPERYYVEGIDYSGDGKTISGQLPGLPPFFLTEPSLAEKAESIGYELGGKFIERASLLSGDMRLLDEPEYQQKLNMRYAGYSRLTCYDNSSYGVALACYLRKTSLLSIKAVNYEANAVSERLNFRRKGLEAMPFIGRLVAGLLLNLSKGR